MRATVVRPDDVEITVSHTMRISDWKKLKSDVFYGPAYEYLRDIELMVREVEKSFSVPEGKET